MFEPKPRCLNNATPKRSAHAEGCNAANGVPRRIPGTPTVPRTVKVMSVACRMRKMPHSAASFRANRGRTAAGSGAGMDRSANKQEGHRVHICRSTIRHMADQNAGGPGRVPKKTRRHQHKERSPRVRTQQPDRVSSAGSEFVRFQCRTPRRCVARVRMPAQTKEPNQMSRKVPFFSERVAPAAFAHAPFRAASARRRAVRPHETSATRRHAASPSSSRFPRGRCYRRRLRTRFAVQKWARVFGQRFRHSKC